jgi:hypothetical protein
VTVKANAEPYTRFSDYLLLLFVGEELINVSVLSVVVYAIKIDVHLPKYTRVRHSLEIIQGINALSLTKRENIGVRHTSGACAALGKADDVATQHRVILAKIFNKTIVKK